MLKSSGKPLTVDELAEAVEYDRSTVYRSVQRLFMTGFVEQEQRNYHEGGYYHVYSVVNTGEVSYHMYRTLNHWYTKMDQLIGDFVATYDGRDSGSQELNAGGLSENSRYRYIGLV
ncbi:helix-turn-helix domain-containing protein [Halorubrum sp. BOL3-1]|uniref:helix-turn-helix domain-containing protein n=1 Tax=Halorubrum sp. BOL3-1 TaxID=2497325 RepID=UPI0026D6D7B6|nr:helix-turn-helix domain-containing protein [Halorubrum sp. BOL3-1]